MYNIKVPNVAYRSNLKTTNKHPQLLIKIWEHLIEIKTVIRPYMSETGLGTDVRTDI